MSLNQGCRWDGPRWWQSLWQERRQKITKILREIFPLQKFRNERNHRNSQRNLPLAEIHKWEITSPLLNISTIKAPKWSSFILHSNKQHVSSYYKKNNCKREKGTVCSWNFFPLLFQTRDILLFAYCPRNCLGSLNI